MPVYTSSIEVTADYPTIKPSLNLNFARSRSLDPRITFTRASTATYIGRDGLVKYAGEDEARFDHDPETLESLGLLIEESRTNIALYSEAFANGWWAKNGGGNPGTTVTSDQAFAPDGTTTADYIDYTTAIANSQNIEAGYDSTPGGKTYTASVWIKGTAGQTINLTLDANGVDGSAAQFTLNGAWQRFSITRTYPAGSPAAYFRFGTRNLNHPSAGTATQIFAWGAQVELGSFSTSYIPTLTSAVTRAGDNASITGESFSSWFNNDEGTLVLAADVGDLSVANQTYVAIENTVNPTGRFVVIGYRTGGNESGGVGGWYTDNGTTSAYFGILAGVTSYSEWKQAFAYKLNDFAASVNGSATVSDGAGNINTTPLDRLRFGQYVYGDLVDTGHIKSFSYYPKRLTNAQLQLLTS